MIQTHEVTAPECKQTLHEAWQTKPNCTLTRLVSAHKPLLSLQYTITVLCNICLSAGRGSETVQSWLLIVLSRQAQAVA